jgi:hypothetical protein
MEYLKSITPVPGTYLVSGALFQSARRWQDVFEKAACF